LEKEGDRKKEGEAIHPNLPLQKEGIGNEREIG